MVITKKQAEALGWVFRRFRDGKFDAVRLTRFSEIVSHARNSIEEVLLDLTEHHGQSLLIGLSERIPVRLPMVIYPDVSGIINVPW